MSITYATVGAEGRVTIPVEIRKAFGIQPGCSVGFRVEDGSVSLELPATLPASIEEIRAMLQASLKANGIETLPPYHNGDGFAAYAKEKYGQGG